MKKDNLIAILKDMPNKDVYIMVDEKLYSVVDVQNSIGKLLLLKLDSVT